MELLVTLLAGTSVVLGALIVRYAKNPDLVVHLSLSLALGAMAALALFDLGPETVELAGEAGVVPALLAVGVGAGILAVLEALVPDHGSPDPQADPEGEEASEVHVGIMTVVALVIHNLVEGMSIYGLALQDMRAGAVYALGVALHNVPMGMLVCSTLRGEPRRVRLAALCGMLLSTTLGGVLMMLVSQLLTTGVMGMLTSIALGMILYIMLAELAPHVLCERPASAGALGVAAGFVLVWVATSLG